MPDGVAKLWFSLPSGEGGITKMVRLVEDEEDDTKVEETSTMEGKIDNGTKNRANR